MQDGPGGTFWCPICRDDIPDTFEDHNERHRAEMVDPTTASVVFWIAALVVGFMGGIIGGVIAASVR